MIHRMYMYYCSTKTSVTGSDCTAHISLQTFKVDLHFTLICSEVWSFVHKTHLGHYLLGRSLRIVSCFRFWRFAFSCLEACWHVDGRFLPWRFVWTTLRVNVLVRLSSFVGSCDRICAPICSLLLAIVPVQTKSMFGVFSRSRQQISIRCSPVKMLLSSSWCCFSQSRICDVIASVRFIFLQQPRSTSQDEQDITLGESKSWYHDTISLSSKSVFSFS